MKLDVYWQQQKNTTRREKNVTSDDKRYKCHIVCWWICVLVSIFLFNLKQSVFGAVVAFCRCCSNWTENKIGPKDHLCVCVCVNVSWVVVISYPNNDNVKWGHDILAVTAQCIAAVYPWKWSNINKFAVSVLLVLFFFVCAFLLMVENILPV